MYRSTHYKIIDFILFKTFSLKRGFFHTWIRLGPWQFIFWNSYE